MSRSTVVHLVVASVFLGSWNCQREIPVLPEETPTNGYRIEGTVSDDLSRPIAGVQVKLFYDPFLEDTGPEPSRSYTLQTANENVEVVVVNPSGNVVRTLFSGTVNNQTITVLWDGTLADGSYPPSGKYTVQYRVSGQTRASYVALVEGTITARSDTDGKFVIPQASLPLTDIVPLYDSQDEFIGIFSLGETVDLEIRAGSLVEVVRVNVRKDVVTTVHVTF